MLRGIKRVFRMKGYRLVIALLSPILVISGCARPVNVRTFQSPTPGVFFTVETYGGGVGPLGSDITKVYAHFERQGKSRRILVLEGDSLTITAILWNTPQDDTICFDGGTTDTFHNQVTLILGDTPENSVTIHNKVNEHCQ
jgi:hypothetical protein